MRVVVYGAGAVGGVVGGMLHRAGHEVVLIARGDHHDAIAADGLTLEMPEGTEQLAIAVTDDPAGADLDRPSVVLLGMKSQHTEPALQRLAAVAPPQTPVVCMQNGVENERRALRLFANTYGMVVMSPTSHLRPGVVQAHSSPVSGLLDLGRYPTGSDDTAHELSAALKSATFGSLVLDDVMRWKYRKLLNNLVNAVDALCGPAAGGSELVRRARREGETVLSAAGIAFASREEDLARRRDDVRILPHRERALVGRIVVAERGAAHRLDRVGLPERGDRAARAGVGGADPGQRATPARSRPAGSHRGRTGPGRPRRAPGSGRRGGVGPGLSLCCQSSHGRDPS